MTNNERRLEICDSINEDIAAAIKSGDRVEATRLNNLLDNLKIEIVPAKKTKINFQRIVAKNSDAENGLLIRAERMTMDY